MRERRGDSAGSILVFRIGQLGDSLISLPAISAIRQRHPAHRLVLLTETQATASGYVSSWDVLGPTGWFDDVVYYEPTPNLVKRLRTMLMLARNIRKLNLEIVYDLAPERTIHQSRRDRFFFRRLAGIKDYRGGGFLCKPPRNPDGKLPRIEPEWRRLLHVVDAEPSTGFCLDLSQTEQRQGHELLQHFGLDAGARVLAVGPGSKMPAKVWPQERFIELGKRLLADDPELNLLVVGGREDAPIGDALCVAWGKRARNLAGRSSIYVSAAVLRHCAAYVGNDAGVMHLAAMVGVSCVGLFSARDYPGQWEPYGAGHACLRHETDCAGCMRTVCPYDNKCLGLISVDEVERAVKSVLEKGTS